MRAATRRQALGRLASGTAALALAHAVVGGGPTACTFIYVVYVFYSSLVVSAQGKAGGKGARGGLVVGWQVVFTNGQRRLVVVFANGQRRLRRHRLNVVR